MTTKKNECAYYSPIWCNGELWQCKTCEKWYCLYHSHATAKGTNVECKWCERERLERAIPNVKRILGPIDNLSESAKRLNIKDK